MNADVTTVAVAVLGVAGTLSSPLLAQRIAARAKQQEFDQQRQQRLEERGEAHQRAALEERRSIYANLNTAARQYTRALRAYLRMISNNAITDDGRTELARARQTYGDVFSDAQMILPDKVMDAATAVNESLGAAYGMVRQLDETEPRPRSGSSALAVETAQEFCRVTLYGVIADMRQLMREDLGVASPDT